jgi:NADH-quinone oxidoreductase subunit M
MNIVAAVFGALGVVLCGAYSLWLYNRLIFGNLKISYTTKFKDLNLREFSILIPLLLLVFLMGVYPSFFLDTIHFSVYNLTFARFY